MALLFNSTLNQQIKNSLDNNFYFPGATNGLYDESEGAFYIGGNFQEVGQQHIGGIAVVNTTNGLISKRFPIHDFTPGDIIEDGSGGFFIGVQQITDTNRNVS